MTIKHLIVYTFFCFQAWATIIAQTIPANIPGDFADPSIIRSGDTYYAIGTSSEWGPHFPIFKSTNLADWEQTGFLFEETPSWAKSSFWAPEYYYHNDTYYVYYTAKRKSDGVSCIGVATSKFPDRGFKDHGILIEYGKEAIDAFVFNDDGQLYITWKAYGLDKRPIEILGSKLSDDGLSLTGESFSLLKDKQGVGIEGQSILKQGQYYYLFYSAGACCGINCNYHVRVARATTLKGPYEEDDNNPILTDRDGWECPGHGTFVRNNKGKTLYIYHAYNKTSNVFTGREALVAGLTWKNDGWPKFDDQLATKTSPQQLHYDFAKENKTIFWQWDFRNMQPVFRQAQGKLTLSGRFDTKYQAGIALTLRPYSATYEVSTAVVDTNEASKGLILYGDITASVGIATRKDTVEFWAIKEGKRTVLNTQQIPNRKVPVYLKMKVLPDFTCRVYWKQSAEWSELTTDSKPYSISFLPPWDRSPRPGLNFFGGENANASFAFFDIKYL